MTRYTFGANFRSSAVNWHDTSIWTDGFVPNASDADVFIPIQTAITPGNATRYYITLSASEAYLTRSLTISGNALVVQGALSVGGALTMQSNSRITLQGGTLSVGSLPVVPLTSGLEGYGTLNSGGAMVIASTLNGSGASALVLNVAGLQNTGTVSGKVTINTGAGGFQNSGTVSGTVTVNTGAGTFQNSGTLSAGLGSVITINAAPGGFSSFANGTLIGGAYDASQSGQINFNVGGPITTIAASVSLSDPSYGGGVSTPSPASISSYDGGSYRNLQSTLQTIASGAHLTLSGQTFSATNALTVAGTVTLDKAYQSPPTGLAAPQLTISSEGRIEGYGVITGQVINNGVIIVGGSSVYSAAFYDSAPSPQRLVIQSSLSGTGSLTIGGTVTYSTPYSYKGIYGKYSQLLELGAASTQSVSFADGTGTLQLDAPTAFTGTITTGGNGDTVILSSIALSSILSRTYVSTGQGGTLVLHRTEGDVNLKFQGAGYTVDSFVLTAGVQQTSTSPPSVIVAPILAPAAPVPSDFTRDGKSDLLCQNDDGALVIFTMDGLHVAAGYSVGNPGADWHMLGSADLNGDGQADILLQNSNGAVVSYLMHGLGIASGASLGNAGPNWHVRGTGDFNGDGKADIVLQDYTGNMVLWHTNGSGVISTAYVGNPGAGWTVEGVADFNGDGKTDILVQSIYNQIVIYTMNGSAIASSAYLGNPGAGWAVAGTGDYNGDGKADILLHADSGPNVIWETNGSAVTASVYAGNPGAGYTRLVAGVDLDGDRKTDLVIQNTDSTLVGYTLNDSAGITAGAMLGTPGRDWRIIGNNPTEYIDGTASAAGAALAATAGADQFNFISAMAGPHYISGFNPAQDTIVLSSAAFPTYATVQANEAAYAGGTFIGFGPSAALVIQGVTPDQLTASNFVLR